MLGLQKIFGTLLLLTLSIHFGKAQDTLSVLKEKAHQQADIFKKRMKGIPEGIAAMLPDSIPPADVKELKNEVVKIDSSSLTSPSVSFENGKWNVPDNPVSTGDAEKIVEEIFSRPMDQGIESMDDSLRHRYGNIHSGNKEELEKLKDRVPGRKERDSIDSLVGRRKLIAQLEDGLTVKRIYSDERLRQLYDSLGVGKFDTLLALASSKQNITEEELLRAVNLSFPASPVTEPISKPEDILELNEIESSRNELEALKPSKPLDKITDLSKLNLPDDITTELPPMPGFQIPEEYKDEWDSLSSVRSKFDNIKTKQNQITEDFKKIIAKERIAFRDRLDFEAIIGYMKASDSLHVLQFSPAVSFALGNHFSLGGGPNFSVNQQLRKLSLTMGYRLFARYEVFDQRAYFQVEDVVDPARLGTESLAKLSHGILAGAGALIPVSRRLAVNVLAMYCVNNADYLGGDISPWVIRVGLSSIKSISK